MIAKQDDKTLSPNGSLRWTLKKVKKSPRQAKRNDKTCPRTCQGVASAFLADVSVCRPLSVTARISELDFATFEFRKVTTYTVATTATLVQIVCRKCAWKCASRREHGSASRTRTTAFGAWP